MICVKSIPQKKIEKKYLNNNDYYLIIIKKNDQ